MRLKIIKIFVLSFLAIFLIGCMQSEGEEQQINGEKGDLPISLLIESLNQSVQDYQGVYYRQNFFSTWRHMASGSTVIKENRTIKVAVFDGHVVNYSSLRYKDGHPGLPIGGEYEYLYNGEICKQDIKTISSGCLKSEQPIRPQMAGLVEGCEFFSNSGLVNKWACNCNGTEVNIGSFDISKTGAIQKFPCKEPIDVEGLELSNEAIIFYDGEENRSLCFFYARTDKGGFAFECLNGDKIKLRPSDINQQVKNLRCKLSLGYCDCSFDSTPINQACTKMEIPNEDSIIKKEILNYLKDVGNQEITRENNGTGNCYSFIPERLKKAPRNIFCFDSQGIVTYVSWGGDFGDSDLDITNITTVKKIE